MTINLMGICGLGGALALGTGLVALANPEAVRRVVAAFPRHIWAGRLLAALALVWVAAIVLRADLGRFSFIKPYLYALTPVAIGLTGWLIAELLAPRALGGLLLLAANPVLAAARWQDSPWRLAVVLAAYFGVLAGTFLVVSPHGFRRSLQPVFASPARARTAGFLLAVLGLFYLGLAFGPFRAS
jgi:hypothetical protein